MTPQEVVQLGAQLMVALGTGLLAFFTWRLARSTSRSVNEMKAERKLTEEALATSSRIASAAESEVAAIMGQVAATQTLAEEAIRERHARWEPLVTARLQQAGHNRPTAVTLENLGPGPAIDCIYAAVITDAQKLNAWFMVGPLNLLGGERVELGLDCAQGVEQISIGVSDDTSVTTEGRPVRREFEVFFRAFDGDERVTTRVPLSRESLGRPAPPAVLFHRPQGPTGPVADRQEAFICRCVNEHVHRTLVHLRVPQEEFKPNDTDQVWLDWYKRVASSGLPCPDIPAKPDAKFIRSQSL